MSPKYKVETACWYRACDKKATLDDWVEAVLKDEGSYAFDMDTQGVQDTRTRAWSPIPLEHFVGRLVDERRKIKKQAKGLRNEGFTTQAEEYDAVEKAIKLFVNTLYGCFASPYFTIGNTVLANNITARARCEVWKVAKALNLSATITDGGNYSLTDVLQLKQNTAKKPGLDWFASISRGARRHNSIQKKKLGGIDWEDIFQNPERHNQFQQLDTLAAQHLEAFWQNYNLTMKMAVEHKMPCIAIKTSHFMKAHYLQLTWDERLQNWKKLNFVIRGARLENNVEFLHPMFEILLELVLERDDLEKIPLEYNHKQLLKISTWRVIQKSAEKTEEEKNIKPGEEIVTKRRYKLFNTHFPVDTLKEYQRKKKRALRKEYESGFE